MTTDYNDGNWHGWNGGECPVHPKSTVQAVRGNEIDATVVTWRAGEFQDMCWHHTSAGGTSNIEAFRVIKEYREAREFWIVNGGVAYSSLTAAEALCKGHDGYKIIHVREVLP